MARTIHSFLDCPIVSLVTAAVVSFVVCLALALIPRTAHASPEWLEDTQVSALCTSTDRVMLDVKDDWCWYAMASGDGYFAKLGWYRSTDKGVNWNAFWESTWLLPSIPIGGAYGFDEVMQIWQPGTEMWFRVIDPIQEIVVREDLLTDWDPCVAKEIVVESSPEGGSSEVFIMLANELLESGGQCVIRTYRTTNHGVSWCDGLAIDSGPAGEPDYIGDLDLHFAYDLYTSCHLVYEKNGQLWHVRSTDSGHSWGTPANLNVDLLPGSSVSVAFDGARGFAVGETPERAIVACYSSNGGATWSASSVVDDPEAGPLVPRHPVVCTGEKPPYIFYRAGNGRIEGRLQSVTWSGWGTESYLTYGETGTHFEAAMSGVDGGNAALLYARSDASGKPYFACWQTPQSAVDSPLRIEPSARLQAWPNPSAGPVTLLLRSDTGGSTGTGAATDGAGDGSSGAATGDDGRSGLITDANGRSIVRLSTPAGPARWIWDGRDAGGHRVAPGVYYARVGGREGATARVVVVR